LEEIINLKESRTKPCFITEITKENIPHCKQILEIIDLRHPDGVNESLE
jgi:hypothetical protein